MELKVNITRSAHNADTVYAEVKLPLNTTVGITVVGIGASVGAALEDAGKQIDDNIDNYVKAGA